MMNKVTMINPALTPGLYRSSDPDLSIFLTLNLDERLMNSGRSDMLVNVRSVGVSEDIRRMRNQEVE
jgi:hypothetical protein